MREVVSSRAIRLVVFDWDGTAIAGRQEDASELGTKLRALSDLGIALVVVTGTSIGHVLGPLRLGAGAFPRDRLFIAANRGSEVFGVEADGTPELVWRRRATADEDRRLDRAAEGLIAALEFRTGLAFGLISDRLNRRKVDLIPEPAWADPPKSALGELRRAVEARLAAGGLPAGLAEAMALARAHAAAAGLPDARITSDVKHVEIGLTDKGDAMTWVRTWLAPALGVPMDAMLVVGDEFGAVGPLPGSDDLMRQPGTKGAVFLSVGPEPNGTPAGVVPLGGGPGRFTAILDAIAARGTVHVPGAPFVPTLDPAWCLAEDGPLREREHLIEARFALGNGRLAVRAARPEAPSGPDAATYVAGLYLPGPDGRADLAIAPDWRALEIEVDGRPIAGEDDEVLQDRTILDMHRGMLLRVFRRRTPDGRIARCHEARWVSLAEPQVLHQSVCVVQEGHHGIAGVTSRLEARPPGAGGWRSGEVWHKPVPGLAVSTGPGGLAIAMAEVARAEGAPLPPSLTLEPGAFRRTWSSAGNGGRPLSVHRTVAMRSSLDGGDLRAAVLADVACAPADPAARLGAHEAAWEARWADADVVIAGDPDAQRAVRFAAYHLIAASAHLDGRASIGARALTGPGYRGHVFWDTEIYMLPFFVHTHPPTARALLAYRHRTLPAARERARALGYDGALFAWESAASGRDETPDVAIGPDGEPFPILTGRLEHHVSADVAHAVWQYWLATGDDDFMREAGFELLVEIARFWASRAEADEAAGYHIRDVIGPDEYHEHVDDNAYTNVMAREALRHAADALDDLRARSPEDASSVAGRLALEGGEPARWRGIAAGLVAGFDPSTGLFEQFAGYFGLEDVDLAAFPHRTLPMSLVLGPERLRRSRIIKQGDVVTLLHLLWDELPPAVRERNYAFYEPRTAHDSSLCRASYGLVAARLGRLDEALRFFRSTAAVDLADDMGNAAQGVHAAALGCLWQLAASGFLGFRLAAGGVTLDPRLPAGWHGLAATVRYRGARLHADAGPDEVVLSIEGPGPVPVSLAGSAPCHLGPGRYVARRGEEGWQWHTSA